MKAKTVIAISFLSGLFFIVNPGFSQKVGTAADKQKQENLEKNKKRQAELKKKYNGMTPQQAEEAKKRANEYKKNGGKATPAGGNTGTTKPATKPAAPAATSKTTQQQKQGTVSKPRNNKPVWMDPNGHAKTTPATTQPAKPEAKPATQPKGKPATTTQTTTSGKPAAQTTKKTTTVSQEKKTGVKVK